MTEINHTISEPLTHSQECDICYIIGDWYLKWKNQLVDYDSRTHRFGYAINDLKHMICKENKEDD